jgi:nucleoid-associated protein YgaU
VKVVQRRNKLIVVAAVLVVGTALALEFRKTGADPATPTPPAPWHAPSAPESSAGQVAANQSPPPSQNRTALDGHVEPSVDRSTIAAGPSASTAPITPGAPQPTVASALASSTHSDLPMVDLNPPERTHKIVDGDTLPNLAQRYLGRADRYQELFERNRDVLKNPEILPIGAELRIPSSNDAPPADTRAPLAPLPTSPAAPDNSPQQPLVPLPNVSVAPAAAQQRSARTYTVQPGDNLVDIARKLYGDGRRHEALFEANRRVLRTPGDLKPGMVLVVP